MAIFGVKKLEVAPVESDGSMPDSGEFSELCKTYRNSVEVVDEDPETNEEFSDQDDDPIAAFNQAGKTQGRFQAFEFDQETLQKLFPDGTVVDDAFKMGKNLGFETALRIQTDSGHTLAWPKVKVFSKLNMQLVKNGVALIDSTFTPLSSIVIGKDD